MTDIIRPWVVRGYDNDTKEQRLFFFDNGYGVSVIDEVYASEGYNAVIIRQITEGFEEFEYSNGYEKCNHMAVLYTTVDMLSKHVKRDHLTEEEVQAILRTVRNLPKNALDNRINL